ncbi:MAG: single-stranded DNA-binding protein, partial [Firmicutes bacterium]|nr:single-stranded DNA-binding protein [Bacillota bacterium]
YNEEVDGRNKLNIVAFVREYSVLEEEIEYVNDVYLEGYICKKPVPRTSPMGRKICDIMLAVNRQYNKSDYIPCIAWGRNAIYSSNLDVGEKIALSGRLQSRQYKKKLEDGTALIKTAYEVSVLQLESLAE